MAKLLLKYGGTYETKGAYSFAAAAPLDTRSVVETIDHLISEDVWKNPDYTAFNGLQVYVESTQELYILKNSSGLKSDLQPESYFTGTTNKAGEVITPPATSDDIQTKVDLYWLKLASAADLSGLSGVFTFKGVAESVSPDLSYIAICSDTLDQSVVPVGTAADLEGDLYYGWSIEGNELWTESSSLDSESTQYVQSGPISVLGIEYNKDFYYPADAMPVGDDFLYAELKNLKGNSIFIPAGAIPIDAGRDYPVYSSQDDVTGIGTGIGFYYKRYRFSENEAPLTISHTHTAILANETNSGHVYQIGENEYASNGQIWVKLGSPVEDWIIL